MIDLSMDLILTTLVLSFWFLFPLGTFLVLFQNDNELKEEKSERPVPVKNRRTNTRRPRLIPH